MRAECLKTFILEKWMLELSSKERFEAIRKTLRTFIQNIFKKKLSQNFPILLKIDRWEEEASF
jgi:hypothetical protein